jgi:hypothetical protein
MSQHLRPPRNNRFARRGEDIRRRMRAVLSERGPLRRPMTAKELGHEAGLTIAERTLRHHLTIIWQEAESSDPS